MAWCRNVFALGLGLLLAGLPACKEFNRSQERATSADNTTSNPNDLNDDVVSFSTARHASGYSEIHSRAKFFYQVWKKPLIHKYGDLPLTGAVADEKRPYSGWWYPEKFGGTDVGSPSALKKYDDVFHDGVSTAAKWEHEHHTRAATDPDANWAGHCNGFSAASSRHQEPFKDVVRGDVTFKPWDTKALLAELYMSATDVFLGGQRCDDNNTDRPDPTRMGPCEDTNPGSFHLAIANWIGRMRQPLVVDLAANDEVWNYPLYKFTVNNNPDPKVVLTKTQANQILTGNGSANYIFNPLATSFRRVSVTLNYANVVSGGESQNPAPNRVVGTKTLEYLLELNDQDEIVGGEWLGSSKNSHPDFIWVAFEPQQGTGVATYGNPHLDVKEVLKIWAESIGADPNDPPATLKLPEWRNNWGKFPNFEITIDGRDTGAVFLGKSIKLQIKRKNALNGKVALEFGMNDRGIIKKQDLSGNEVSEFEIEPIVGINRLAFIWKRNGVEMEAPTFVRFHALP